MNYECADKIIKGIARKNFWHFINYSFFFSTTALLRFCMIAEAIQPIIGHVQYTVINQEVVSPSQPYQRDVATIGFKPGMPIITKAN